MYRIFAGSLVTIISIILVSLLTEGTTAQYDASYCEGKRDEMIARGGEWGYEWDTAMSDPGGQIRADGKQLASEIGLTLVNCDASLNDHDKLTLMQFQQIIDKSIENNVNYGPPCDPNCQPGPPIS